MIILIVYQDKKFLKRRKSMICQYIKKLMVVIMELLIIILLKVQANVEIWPSLSLPLQLPFNFLISLNSIKFKLRACLVC